MVKRWAAIVLLLLLSTGVVALVVARPSTDTMAAEPAAPAQLASLSVILGNPWASSQPGVGDQAVPTLTVRGPDGFVRFLTATAVLRDLEPGTYTVTASPADTPRPAPQAGDRRAVVLPPQGSVTLQPGDAEAVEFVAVPVSVMRTSGGAHAFEAENLAGPVRWDPCTAITWSPTSDIPASEEALIAQAFDQAAADSGLSFVRVGSPDDAKVRVNVQFRPGTRVDGEGSMTYLPKDPDRQQIAINGAIEASIGTSTSAALRTALYLHEIGHVVGLSHVDDQTQVMHPEVSESDAVGFAAGDREGLKRVGALAGCLSSPQAPLDLRADATRTGVEVAWFQPASVPGVESAALRVHSAAVPGVPDMFGTYTLDVQPLRDRGIPGYELGLPDGRKSTAPSSERPLSGTGAVAEPGAGAVPLGGWDGWLGAEVTGLPGGPCAAGTRMELVVTNANGDTVVPVPLGGCASGSPSRTR